jgi:hypothetical protein
MAIRFARLTKAGVESGQSGNSLVHLYQKNRALIFGNRGKIRGECCLFAIHG